MEVKSVPLNGQWKKMGGRRIETLVNSAQNGDIPNV